MTGFRERIARLEVDARRNAVKIADRREILDWAMDQKRQLAAINEAKASGEMGHSASAPSLSLAGASSVKFGRADGCASLGGGTRPGASGKLFTSMKDSNDLLKRIQLAGSVASRNHEELMHRRNVLDAKSTTSRDHGSGSLSESAFNRSVGPSPSSMHSGRMQSSMMSGGSSLAADVERDSWTPRERRRVPNQTYLDMIDGAKGNNSDSFKLEWADTLSKEVAPALMSPTAPMKERFEYFEQRAMWNAHRMAKQRKELQNLRVY